MCRRPSPLSRALAATAAFAGLLALPPAAGAQIFAGVGTDRALALPSTGAARLSRPAADPSDAKPSVPTATDLVRHLPGTLDGWRLTGEIGTLRWPVFLTAAQAAAPVRFRVGFVSAISLLPEASSLEVTINGTAVGSTPIDAAQAMRTMEFAVPGGLLQHGYNSVAINVQQRHRVDCSAGATYELWTRFDPARTGLVLAAGDVADIADLAALAPRPDGAMPIHVVLGGKINPAQLKQLIAATQRIALSGGFLQPAIDFDAANTEPYGVDLVLGTRASLGSLAGVAGALGDSGPVARLLPAGGRLHPTLLVTGSTGAEIDRAVALVAAGPSTVGTAAGLLAQANYPAHRSEGGEDLSLRDLAISSENFSGRFFRKSFNLSLPADFLASDYGRGTFDLAGGYASGLAGGAQVSVDVNGRSSGVIKLPYRDGDVFKHKQLFLPLSLMRPGLNRIDVFAETERPEDGSCGAPASKRFLFLDTSEIVLPRLARVQRLPDLALATSGGLPFTHGTARLVVPKPDRETMGAALSLTTRAAVAAGTLIPFSFATSTGGDEAGATLVVASARTLDPALVRAVGVDPARIETAWRDLPAPPKPATGAGRDTSVDTPVDSHWWMVNADGPAACRLPTPMAPTQARASVDAPAIAKAVPVATTTASDDILESWSAKAPDKGWLERMASASAGVVGWLDGGIRSLRLPAAKAATGDGIARNASLILAQGFAGSSDNVTTIVTAPNSETLRAAVACLFDPKVWSRVHGRLAALDASSGDVVATDAREVRYLASGSWSLANSRLVLAGWLSLNPLMFVLVALLAALCLSATTFWFVRGIGRRPE